MPRGTGGIELAASEETIWRERPNNDARVAGVTNRGPLDEQPYIMQDEQRATRRMERSEPILPPYRDFWVFIGILLVLFLMFIILVGYKL
jgi:hypothetical protein